MLEWGGIPSTILMGWWSDRLRAPRHGEPLVHDAHPLAFGVILLTPPGYLWLDMRCWATIGFFVYPPVMLAGAGRRWI